MERAHRTIEQVLRALLLDHPTWSWVDALPYVEFALNSTQSASTQHPPFELVYGSNVSLPVDLVLDAANPPTTDAPTFAAKCARVVSDAQAHLLRVQ